MDATLSDGALQMPSYQPGGPDFPMVEPSILSDLALGAGQASARTKLLESSDEVLSRIRVGE